MNAPVKYSNRLKNVPGMKLSKADPAIIPLKPTAYPHSTCYLRAYISLTTEGMAEAVASPTGKQKLSK